MQSKLSSIILVVSASLSLAAIGIIPIYHQASAKECNNNNDGSSCSNKQGSDSNSNSDHNNKHSSSQLCGLGICRAFQTSLQ